MLGRSWFSLQECLVRTEQNRTNSQGLPCTLVHHL